MANPIARPLNKRVLLMGTCLCDAFYDDVASATVEVLEHLGIAVEFPENQTCCGQPAFNSGDWVASRKVARHTADVFAGDLPVIVPSGSCAAMNFHGNLLQFEENPDPAIDSLARRTWEVMDFIYNGLGIKTWPGKFDKPTRIAFHRSCHSRGTGTRRGRPLPARLHRERRGRPLRPGRAMLRLRRHVFGHLPAHFRPDGHRSSSTTSSKPSPTCSSAATCPASCTSPASPSTQGRPVKHLHAIQILRDTLP